MKRTNVLAAATAWLLVVSAAPGQQPPPPPAPVQTGPVDALLAAMQAAEAKLDSVAVELSTHGQLPGGLQVRTRGVLHVLRGTQPATHVRFEFEFDDGIRGRAESAQTADGIVLFEDDPAFGEVHVRIEPPVVADLEWAGQVLQRDDLPGMADRRAQSPLGAALVADLRRQFELDVEPRAERGGDRGIWLGGARRAGLDVQDPDLPIADRVQLFVRARDHALLEVRYLQAGTTIQHLVVDKLEVGVPLAADVFRVDGAGQRLRPVQQHQPLWEQIEQVVRQAEARSADGVVRPSRR